MGAILRGAFVGFEWWCGLSALGAVAYCAVMARHNAAVRATRRQMRAEVCREVGFEPPAGWDAYQHFLAWEDELGAALPTIDFEEWDK